MLNGNFTGNQLNDVDTKKDIMARATYSLKFPGAGIGIDFGAHVYYGGLMAKNKYILNYENVTGQYFRQYTVPIWIKNGAELKCRYILMFWAVWP